MKTQHTVWGNLYLRNTPGAIFHNSEEFVFAIEARLALREMASLFSHESDEEVIFPSIELLCAWIIQELLKEKCEIVLK